MADGVVEQQQRDAGGQERDQIGEKKCAAAVFEGDVGETPNVAQADGRADSGNHKRAAVAKRRAFVCFGIRHVDTSCFDVV